ncbi:VOC family protein [Hydrogenophaga sp. 2FB]|uniref:VOC family protein n=1 Tax=Hydrogenophaga sp. 2FB TaxID=2502187 RepID=UPI0010F7C516|nr:VOC family protein [Hydrogenophaga sp. 2FB]
MNTLRELVGDAIAEEVPRASIIQPYVISHGTLECADMQASRKFYQEFLGLEVVQHGPRAMAIRCGLKFHIICVQVGEKIHPMSYLTHWGIDVQSREAVDSAHAAALANTEKYAIRKVADVVEQHGVYSFYLQDLDHNWWEVQHYEAGYQHNDIFDFGDVYTSSLDGVAP